MAASEVFCKDFIDISYKSASFCILEDSMWLQLIYIFTYNFVLVCEMSFPDHWDTIY